MLYSPSLAGIATSPLRLIGMRATRPAHAYHSRQPSLGAPSSLSTQNTESQCSRFTLRSRAYASRLVCATYSTRATDRPQTPMRRSNTILFRGLHADFDEEEVEGFFSQCGEVIGAKIKYSPYAVASSAGYVQFASQKSVDKALALHNTEILGRSMVVYALYELPDTIDVGCLPLGVDENRVKTRFSSCGQIVDVKIHTSLPGTETRQCYAFIRFASSSSATKALKLHRTMFAGRRLHVCRARQRAEDISIWDNYAEASEETARTINVSAIPPQVDEDQLKAEFEHCGEVALARVWRALTTGNSLGFGFVRFASPGSVEHALATPKSIAGHPIRVVRVSALRPPALDFASKRSEFEPTRSVFVGRLTHDVDEHQLRREFERFGKIVRVRILKDRESGKSRGCGYVNFASPDSVELAVQHDDRLKLNGFSVMITRNYSLPKSQRQVVASDDAGHDPYDSRYNTDSWEYDY